MRVFGQGLFRVTPFFGIILSLACIAAVISGSSIGLLLSGVALPYLIWASYAVFGLSSIILLLQLLLIPSAARMAADGFYCSVALVFTGILGGVAGIVARLDPKLGVLDVKASLIPLDPSELTALALILMPVFVVLRALTDALDAYLRSRPPE